MGRSLPADAGTDRRSRVRVAAIHSRCACEATPDHDSTLKFGVATSTWCINHMPQGGPLVAQCPYRNGGSCCDLLPNTLSRPAGVSRRRFALAASYQDGRLVDLIEPADELDRYCACGVDAHAVDEGIL